MGIHPSLDLQRLSSIPDTPPDLVSPSSSTYSSRISERSWHNSTPVSPPMSSYEPSTRPDMSAGKGSEGGSDRRDAHTTAPRQQLPSLSSLFGPVPHVRPLHSPHSDRPSPLYGTQSPLERPLSAAANPERPYSRNSSYFPSVPPPVAQPRSVYEPRLEPERPTLPSVAAEFPGPLSPPMREPESTNHSSRLESSPSAKWVQSAHQDPRRPEYVFGSRPSTPSFGAGYERIPLPPLSHSLGREPNALLKEGQIPPTMLKMSPPSRHVVTSEGGPVKDGLGPKIWTGTHFLPRFVRQAEVPGEGLCYFYDDGTHCKTVIDGEHVNAHWGVTKAGKPRKRLAIACLTCREKKIKCDPDYPRCVQCEKFGRVCKFKNAPRGGHNTSPVTSPAEHDDSRQLGAPPRAHDTNSSSAPVSPRLSKLSHPSPELPGGIPAKRMKFSAHDQHYPPPLQPTSRPSLLMPQRPPEMPKGSLSWPHRELPRMHEDILCRPWQSDPYVSKP
ncbi:hypothetical protein F4778DRAFT_136019 [Xylariomycetidae sp. FL2044]|nr:hypothetical protein F4778DRAFT_136019 [Xylariomycetidae sp. FL2044]